MTDNPYPQSKSAAIRFEGRVQAAQLVATMAQQARRRICVFGPDIDAALFDNSAFIESVSQLARHSSTSRTTVQILVHSSFKNVQTDHRIIALAQRLTSAIHIHNTAKQHRHLTNTSLIIDDFAYLNCPLSTVYTGSSCLYDRLEVRQLHKKFDELWQQSSPDITIRRLDL